MNVLSTDIEGLVVVQPPIHSDERGSFVKTYNEALFKDLGIGFRPREEFFSISHRNVIRGMHFQLPPADHAKVVYCLTGSILDVVLDLRTGGRTYGKWWTRELNDVSRELVHIPLGCAHGFLSLTEGALTAYLVGSEYDVTRDTGIRWDSFGYQWPVKNPIVSSRDQTLPRLAEFVSAFN